MDLFTVKFVQSEVDLIERLTEDMAKDGKK